MIETHGKILITAFVALIIGIVLIQAIGNDVESTKVSSVRVENEALTFSDFTTDVANESQPTTGDLVIASYNLTNNNVTILTEIRNSSSAIVTSQCNITFFSGEILCNITNSTNLFFEYTFVSGKTVTLANDEVTLTWLRNLTVAGNDLTPFCNVTSASGAINCNNTYGTTAAANYTYIPDGFVRGAASRNLLTLTVLFFAIAILAIGIGMAVKSFKESGVL